MNGRYAIIETLAQQGSELPVHVHQGEDELLLVLSGRVCVRAGPVEQQLAAGETVHLRRGVPHALRLETATVRLLTIFFLAGFEHYVEAVAQPVSPCQAPPELQAVGPPNVPLLVATAQRYGFESFPELPGSDRSPQED